MVHRWGTDQLCCVNCITVEEAAAFRFQAWAALATKFRATTLAATGI
jgi:hypothetical protein